MTPSTSFICATLVALALASLSVKAQAEIALDSTHHARAKRHHTVEMTKEEGRQITVNRNTPSWLTLGSGSSVGYGNNYVTNTFDQPSTVEGTFSGYRGRERLINQYGVPGVPLFRF